MNRELQLKTRFAPETRFDVAPVPVVPFRGAAETELEWLKRKLLRELLAKNQEPEFNAPLRRAANEAAALAWLTPFPLLLLPTLLEEKAAAAQRQIDRQGRINERSHALLLEAV